MNTIKSKREIDKIFREGKRIHTPLFIALTSETVSGRDLDGRVAFVAGKKLGSAPLRSRCKRVLREAVRRSEYKWPGKDIVFISKRSVACARAEDIADHMRRLTQRINNSGDGSNA